MIFILTLIRLPSGFNRLMPEGRPAPSKFFPKPGVDLSITFGQPLNNDDIKAALRSVIGNDRPTDIHSHAPREVPRNKAVGSAPGLVYDTAEELRSEKTAEEGWLGDVITPVARRHSTPALRGDAAASPESLAQAALAAETERIRSAVTAILQRDVEALGRKVLGDGAGSR